MAQVIDWLLHWKGLEGKRGLICQILLVVLAGYSAAAGSHLIPGFIKPEVVASISAVLTAYAAKFAADHKTG